MFLLKILKTYLKLIDLSQFEREPLGIFHLLKLHQLILVVKSNGAVCAQLHHLPFTTDGYDDIPMDPSSVSPVKTMVL